MRIDKNTRDAKRFTNTFSTRGDMKDLQKLFFKALIRSETEQKMTCPEMKAKKSNHGKGER